jgi:hypothetical protein
MFSAAFASIESSKCTPNCGTYIKRSRAYAHLRNLHRLSVRVTELSEIDDVDSRDAPFPAPAGTDTAVPTRRAATIPHSVTCVPRPNYRNGTKLRQPAGASLQ